MASDIVQSDYDKEKQQVGHHIEHANTHTTTDSVNELQQEPTLSGSQVILYFTGASLSFIEEDLGLARGSAWLPTANILAIAAVCPYAGYLQDLFGKRYIALFGSFCICLGCALVGSGHSFAQLLAGMAISGAGAATGELTGLAGLAEVVPVKYRSYYLALVTAFVLPFCPYLLYVELWSHNDDGIGWRWGP
ncbi:hypothetical protein G6011_03924 [Alternaria panax]|uniref:Major facilitator superfamily (MFS) profile domain-containing protein n=1 Tax=Alternaria panax TaxID=48097 RepID=A0AAD4IG59_9PLEO|nr:hypothetical protein G6011_03924 [Alternaria panax]